MKSDNLELKDRALSSDGEVIGLNQYDEILTAIYHVITDSISNFKIISNHKDPTHRSQIYEFFDSDIIKDALQHSHSMGVKGHVVSIHPDFKSPNLESYSQVCLDDKTKLRVIKMQTDSEVVLNDRGECVLFSKYKDKKKLPNNEFINLFSVNKTLSNSIDAYFLSLVDLQDGGGIND